MSVLYDEIVSSDFLIFSSPVYCSKTCGTFKLILECLYPMLGGGPALGEGLKPHRQYQKRIPGMLIQDKGMPLVLCRNVKKQIESNLKRNGFKNMGTIVIDGTYIKIRLV